MLTAVSLRRTRLASTSPEPSSPPSLPTARGSSEHAPRSLAPGANTNTPGTTQPFIWEADRHLGAPPPAHPGLCPAEGTGENTEKLQRGGGKEGKKKIKEKFKVWERGRKQAGGLPEPRGVCLPTPGLKGAMGLG